MHAHFYILLLFLTNSFICIKQLRHIVVWFCLTHACEIPSSCNLHARPFVQKTICFLSKWNWLILYIFNRNWYTNCYFTYIILNHKKPQNKTKKSEEQKRRNDINWCAVCVCSSFLMHEYCKQAKCSKM